MKSIKCVRVHFNNFIGMEDIPMLRGSIAAGVGFEHTLFHNHIEKGNFRMSYPLIQYKSHRNKALLVGLEEGALALHELFNKPELTIQIGPQAEPFSVEKLQLFMHRIRVASPLRDYRLSHWLPLNTENYVVWKNTPKLSEKIALLERILTGNILSMAKGLDWRVEDQIQVHITQIKKERLVSIKHKPWLSFDISFKTNVELPNYIGLGKFSSLGYGLLLPPKRHKAVKK